MASPLLPSAQETPSSDPVADLRAARAESDTPPAPMTPSKTAPSKEPMSISGFGENVMGQLYDIGKGLIQAWPTAIKSGVQIAKYANDPFEAKDLGHHFLDAVGDTASHVASGIAGPESDYAKHGMRVFYDKPITPILDAMTVMSLGGGMVGRAGKLAGGLSRAGMAAEDVAKLGEMSTADRIATIGDHIANVPDKIGKAITEAPLRAVGINPDSLKVMRQYEGESKTWANQAKYEERAQFDKVFKGFSDADKAALDKMAMEGTSTAELAANPKAAAALDNWKRFLADRESILGSEGRNLLSEGAMQDVVAKKYANRVLGGVTEDNVAAAKAAIEAMPEELRPVYTPAIGEKAEHSILDLLRGKEEVVPPGAGTGFLKPYKGTGDRISDPTIYMRKGAQQFLDMEQKLKFIDTVIRDPKLTRLAEAGDKTLADLMPEGFYRKFAADKLRAQGKAVAPMVLEEAQNAKAAGLGPEAVGKAMDAKLADPVVQKYLSGLQGVAAQNSTVGRYLKFAFARQPEELATFIRIYDKVMGLFKVTSTVASPRWHVANIVGDAVLSTMAGEYGLNWKLMRQAVSSMPPYLREGGKYISMEIGGWDQRYLNKLSDVTQAADDLARRGIWTKEVAGKFKQAAASFAAADGSLEDFVKHVGQAHTDLPNLQSAIQQLDEQIARGSKKVLALDAEIDGLKKELAKAPTDHTLTAKIDELYNTRQNIVADRRSKLIQSGQVEQAIPGLQKYAEVSRQGIERGNAFLGDYLMLGPIERSVFRRIVPFYAWTKAMAKLTFTLPFIAPKTAFFWHRWSQALATMAGDKNLPDYMQTYAPIGTTMVQGKPAMVWIDATAVSHFGKSFQTRFGDVPIPKLLAFWRENPFLQTGYRLVGGRDEFYWAGKPQNGQVWVSAGDGTVKRFRPDGKIEQVVPQAPIIKTLAHMFPAVQIQEQLTTPYDVNKGNALNPDGSYRFPKELWQRITELFGPKTKVGNAQDLANNELRGVQYTLKDLQHMYIKATPEEREYIRGVFEDYQKGMFRRMKTGGS